MHKVRLLLQTPSMRKCTYRPGRKIFGKGDRGSAKITGAEQEKADMHAAYTSQFLFLRLLELSVQQHSQRKKRTRSTLVFQTLCQKHTIKAILLQLTQHQGLSFGAEKMLIRLLPLVSLGG